MLCASDLNQWERSDITKRSLRRMKDCASLKLVTRKQKNLQFLFLQVVYKTPQMMYNIVYGFYAARKGCFYKL